MMDMPIIKIEIERLKYGVASLLASHNEELNKYTKEAIDKTLSADWVMSEIDKSVEVTIKTAIGNI